MTRSRSDGAPAGARAASPMEALAALRSYGQHSAGFLALNIGNEYFTVDGSSGVIVYRPFGRGYWVQFTGPIAPPEECADLERAFAEAAASARRRVIKVQLLREDAERAAADGYVVNQFGSSYSIELAQFGLLGGKFRKTRSMVSRSRKAGVTVSEVSPQRQAEPEFAAQLDAIDAAWLRSKGKHTKELEFLIGQRGGPMQEHRRLFVAEFEGRPVAYLLYSPVFGRQHGWLADLERRMPDSPPGVADHIFSDAAKQLHRDGAEWLHLGLTPFVGLEPEYRIDSGHSKMVSWALNTIRERGAALYPADSALAFKLKWRPHVVTPEYIAFPGRFRLRDAWCLARTTNAL
ncbi:phosphatidylglycerol lysyltransferase domain-containing protein [Nocardia asteroides]